MHWPSPQEYNEAIQMPQACLSDPELQGGQVELTRLGLPKVVTGAFASVYRFRCRTRTVAVRCFLRNIQDIEDRYLEISKFIMNDTLPYTVDFEYIRKGILVAGTWFPLLKMDWVEGESLLEYLSKNIRDARKLQNVLAKFDQMALDLREAGIAHGDLQHGNIMVVGDELRLVDYDGMFVPSLAGRCSNEIGHRNYQHPARSRDDFGPHLDNFSVWVIRTALLALICDNSIWHAYGVGDECLILRQADFVQPEKSTLFRRLLSHRDAYISQNAKLLSLFASKAITDIPEFIPNYKVDDLIAALGGVASCQSVHQLFGSASLIETDDLWSEENIRALAHRKDDRNLPPHIRAAELLRQNKIDEAMALLSESVSVLSDVASPEDFLLSRARGFIKLEMYDRAVQDLKKLSKIFPQNLDIHLNLAVALIKNEKVSEGMSVFKLCRQIAPDDGKTDYFEGLAHQRLGGHLQALKRFEDCLKRTVVGDLRCRANYQSVVSASATEQYWKAVGFYKNAANAGRVQPNDEIEQCYQFSLAMMALKSKSLDEASSLLEIAKSFQGTQLSATLVAFGLAAVEALRGRSEKAMIAFSRLEQQGFENEWMFCKMGRIRLNESLQAQTIQAGPGITDKRDRAREYFNKALQMDPNYAEALLGMGQAHLLDGETNLGYEFIRKAVAADPRLYAAQEALAKILEERCDFVAAAQCYEKMASLDATDVQSSMKAGTLFMNEGAYQRAQSAFELAVLRRPSAEAYYAKAMAAMKLGDHAGALEDLKSVIAIDPAHSQAYLELAVLQKARGEVQQAIFSLDHCLKHAPKHVEALLMRAQMLFDLGHYQNALVDCDKALMLSSLLKAETLNTIILRGRCLAALGAFDKAIDALEAIMSINSSVTDEVAWSTLATCLSKKGRDRRFRQVMQIAYDRKLLLTDGQLAIELGRALVRLAAAVSENEPDSGSQRDSLFQQAIDSFSRHCRLDSQSAVGFFERAECYREVQEFDKASADYEKAVALISSGHAYGLPGKEKLVAESQLYLAIFRLKTFEAAVDYNRLPRINERCTEIMETIGLFESAIKFFPEMGKRKETAICWRWKAASQPVPAEALKSLTWAITVDPGDECAHWWRAQVLIQLKYHDEALEALANVRTKASLPVGLYKGECLLRLGRFEDAVLELTEFWKKIAGGFDRNLLVRASFLRGLAHRQLGDSDQALDDFCKVIAGEGVLDEDISIRQVCGHVAELFSERGNQHGAVDFLAGFPAQRFFDVAFERALLRQSLSDYSGAVKEWNELAKVAKRRLKQQPEKSSPRLGQILTLRAKAYVQLKKINQARNDLKEAMQYGSNLEAFIVLAQLMISEGKYDKARELINKATEIHGPQPGLTDLQALAQRS